VDNVNTENLNSKRPFEERVFARFDALDLAMRVTDSRLENVDSRLENMDSRLVNMDSRLQKLEIRAYDTKPIWEQALKEIVDTRKEIVDTRRELSKRLDRIEAITIENRADLRDVEDRIDKIERKPVQ
jgi:chromosome segregation ATPase